MSPQFYPVTNDVFRQRPKRGVRKDENLLALSADPRDHPAIQPNYLASDADRRVAADSIRVTRRIMAARALARFEPDEFLPGAGLASDEDLAKASGEIGTTIFHPVGTCKMGRDERAVVDERLRVRGIAGLRVADASVMPVIPRANTNIPTLMVAEKAAVHIAQDLRRGVT